MHCPLGCSPELMPDLASYPLSNQLLCCLWKKPWVSEFGGSELRETATIRTNGGGQLAGYGRTRRKRATRPIRNQRRGRRIFRHPTVVVFSRPSVICGCRPRIWLGNGNGTWNVIFSNLSQIAFSSTALQQQQQQKEGKKKLRPEPARIDRVLSLSTFAMAFSLPAHSSRSSCLCSTSEMKMNGEMGERRVRIMTIKSPWIELAIDRTSFWPFLHYPIMHLVVGEYMPQSLLNEGKEEEGIVKDKRVLTCIWALVHLLFSFSFFCSYPVVYQRGGGTFTCRMSIHKRSRVRTLMSLNPKRRILLGSERWTEWGQGWKEGRPERLCGPRYPLGVFSPWPSFPNLFLPFFLLRQPSRPCILSHFLYHPCVPPTKKKNPKEWYQDTVHNWCFWIRERRKRLRNERVCIL